MKITFKQKKNFVTLLTVTVFILGIYSLVNIQRDNFPVSLKKPILNVSIPVPGIVASEIEKKVINKIEQELENYSEIESYISYSIQNYAKIEIKLYSYIKNIDNVLDKIEKDILNIDYPIFVQEKPQFWRWKAISFPILHINFTTQEKNSIEDFKIVSSQLKEELMKEKRINEVKIAVSPKLEYRIKLNPESILQYGLSVNQIIDQIKARNIFLTIGQREINNNTESIIFYSDEINLQTIEELKIITPTNPSQKIALKKLATFEKRHEQQYTLQRLNGENSLALYISKKKDADTIRLVNKIKDITHQFLKENYPHIEVNYSQDFSKSIANRINIAKNNMLIGAVLILIVLFSMTHYKTAFWAMFSMIFTFITFFIFYYQAGMVINNATVLALIIIMGIVVDDSIIIAENIYRNRILTGSWRIAAKKGVLEIIAPVSVTVLTTIVAFLPLSFLEGDELSTWAKELPKAIIPILCISLIEGFFLIPIHMRSDRLLFFKIKEKHNLQERKIFIWMKKKYELFLQWLLNYDMWVVFFTAIFIIISLIYLLKRPFITFPDADTEYIVFEGSVNNTRILSETVEEVKKIETIINNYPTNVVSTYLSTTGEPGFPNKYKVEVFLTHPSTREVHSSEIIHSINFFYSSNRQFVNTRTIKDVGGAPEGKDISVKIVEKNKEKLKQFAEEYKNYLSSINGISEINVYDENFIQDVKVEIDEEKIFASFVNPKDILRTLQVAFNGETLFEINENSKIKDTKKYHYQVRLSTLTKSSNLIDQISSLIVYNQQNNPIPIVEFVKIKYFTNILEIKKYNGIPFIMIEAELNEKIKTPKSIYDKLKEHKKIFLQDKKTAQLLIDGVIKQSSDILDSTLIASVFAILGVFIIIYFLFKSLVYTFLTILAIPLSLIGVALAIWIHDMSLSYLALIGVIGLVGIVVNDSLVLITFINRLKNDHSYDLDNKTKKEKIIIGKNLIVQGSTMRMRPIVLTTVTTAFGMLPTAYGLGGLDSLIVPMTIIIGWGLCFSTIFILTFIPCLYSVSNRLLLFFTRR